MYSDDEMEEETWLEQMVNEFETSCRTHAMDTQLTFKEFLHFHIENRKADAIFEVADAIRFMRTPVSDIAGALEVMSEHMIGKR
jgi:hypothetical protein